ncbi:MAG: hypothetical protein M1816_000941 [Peltula sp. TS41687]|nr:MAG: hypothetical protein M1816_000941 [Peltula sp. TS41687]
MAAEKQKQDPRLWETYFGKALAPAYPPFAPPDIGPLHLEDDFFGDYPGLTAEQKRQIKNKNRDHHKRHQKAMAKQWNKTGKQPTEVEVKQRAREIRGVITEAAAKAAASDPAYAPQDSAPRSRMKRLLEMQKKSRPLGKQLGWDVELQNEIREADRVLREAERTMKESTEEIARMSEQSRRALARQEGLTEGSKDYRRLEKQIQRRKYQAIEAANRHQEAVQAAQRARVRIIERKGWIQGRPQEGKQIVDGTTSTDDPEASKDQSKDENKFSMTALENGARRWIQGVGGFLQHQNQRESTQGGNIHLQPVGNLPKLGPIGGPW